MEGRRSSSPGRAAPRPFGDVDGNGAIDVLVVNRDAEAHLLLNIAGARDRSLVIEVRERSGRYALGATLELHLGDRVIRRDVRGAYSYLAANDPKVHVGLGDVAEARRSVVRWGDGRREDFGPLAPGRVHVLRRGEGTAEE